jgi:hypothetical protein
MFGNAVCTVFLLILNFFYLKNIFLYRFDVLILKIIFKIFKKNYFNIFLNKKYFKLLSLL